MTTDHQSNDFELLEKAFSQSRKLFSKGANRIAINPMFGLYNNREYKEVFLHIDFENEEHQMYQYKNFDELLNKINQLLGERS
jgi:hypothetical protein